MKMCRKKRRSTEVELEERSLLGKVDVEVYERLKLRFTAKKQWITNRRDEIQHQLEQLNRQAEAKDVLNEIHQKFWRRLDTLSTAEWRDLLLLLNVEVHVRPVSYMDKDHAIPGDFSLISNIWRDIEQDKFRWAEPKSTDTIIEIRFGVPLGSIEPWKVSDCVLPTSPPFSPSLFKERGNYS